MNLNPLVLNMASPKRPGGGFRNGSAAQEENIFRRSNYFQVLEDLDRFDKNRKWKYPLGEFTGISALLIPSWHFLSDLFSFSLGDTRIRDEGIRVVARAS